MTNTETRRFEMLQRVRGFQEAHRDLFPPESLAGQAFTTIETVVEQLRQEAMKKKVASAQGRSHAKSTARRALLERLEAIDRCARVIAEDTPFFDAPFQLPPVRSDQAILTTGRVVAQEGEAVKARFAEFGMPESIIEEVGKLVADFEAAIHTREAGRDDQTAARSSIDAAIAAGLAAVRKLDIIVGNRLRDDPATRAVWDRDRRIDYFPRGRRASRTALEAEGEPAVPEELPDDRSGTP